MEALPADYAERVYAGVLGKIIGVYLGRPFEGWRHGRIMDELGDITYYVNDRRDVELKNYRLIVTDDDITGTFVFARAMGDYPIGEIDAIRVGHTWLNYLVENRTVLWWGGMGNSTEHTAYLRMLDGVRPPESGSIARNGKVVAEQVGAEIFVEGWALACPGDPEKAAFLAGRAASVSHDGEALHAARVVAAMVAQAFVERNVDKLLDAAVSLIPADALIRRVIDDVREWHAIGEDWKQGFRRIDERYGYERYGGNCHVVPNHALVVHSLLHGAGDFSRSIQILTSCGWDTDSNGGNVGCIAGVLAGLSGIDGGPDWRGPVADRMYLPTADGGSTITDAAREATTIVGYAHALRGKSAPVVKNGARFHFNFPGAVQGFSAEPASALRIENVAGFGSDGQRSLAVRYRADSGPALALTPTFLTPDTVSIPPYGMAACPTLYPGQVVRARLIGEGGQVTCSLAARAFSADDRLRLFTGSEYVLAPGESAELIWQVPDTGAQPIADVGIEVRPRGDSDGTVYLDYLTWEGEPDIALTRPAEGGTMWRHAWVDAVDSFLARWPEPFRVVQNRGTGLLIHGSRDWRDYEVTADVTPHMAHAAGLCARVGGMRRYYALRLVDRAKVQLVRAFDTETVLAEQDFSWTFGTTYNLRLTVAGDRIQAAVDDVVLNATDPNPLPGGAVALLIEEGRTATNLVRVRSAALADDRLTSQ